jgi:hypothetical protein
MTGGDGTMSVHAPASVVIPTLNEIAHIGGLIDHLLSEPGRDGGRDTGRRRRQPRRHP